MTTVVDINVVRRAVDRALVEARPAEDGDRPVGVTFAALLRDPDMSRPPEPVVDRLAWHERVTLFVAREKTGKSTLLAAAAAAVTRGQGFLGADPREPGDVIWVGLEEAAPDVVQRFMRFGGDPSRISLVRSVGSLAQLGAELAVLPSVRLVVIDTLAALADSLHPGIDENDAAQMTRAIRPIVDLARECDAGWVLAAHANKAQGAGYRGSSAIGASVDMILTMEPTDETTRRMEAKGRWHVAPYSVALEPSGYRLVGSGALASQTAHDAEILAALTRNPGINKSTVARILPANRNRVFDRIEELLRCGLLEDRGTGGQSALHVRPSQLHIPLETK